jgi:hypothetical protein
LNRNLTRLSSESSNTPGYKEPAEPTPQIRGWLEVAGPDGIPILQELSDHEPDTDVPRPADTNDKYWLVMQFAHDKPEPASGDSLVSKESDRLTVKCPICRADVPRPLKNHNKRMNVRQQMAFCNDHKLRDAKAEWARRGYPRIGWRRLDSRLKKFSSTLRGILKGESPSFYHTELELAVARREGRKYRCMEYATAGYYGPRGQQIM